MQSTMMDVPLSLNHLLERAGTLFARNEIVSRLPDKSLRTHTLRRVPPAHARARRRRCRSSGLKKRRSRRDAVLEPPCPPRVLLRHSGRRRRDAHAEPAPVARRDRLDRDDAEDRFLVVDDVLLPLYRQFADQARVREGDRVPVLGRAGRRRGFTDYEALLAGGRRRRLRLRAARRERPGRDVLHVGHHRAAEGRRLLAPLDGAAHAGRLPRRPLGPARHRRACCRSRRCSMPTAGACRTAR